ncbi:uncharacterized protein LOC109707167 [Ananas comosus]|uniref:Uncharacterized protein LOC109707167 n=2 Tax=Ananas comosus TaxID=4615 RepID=A0A6P5ERE4_ANACO|nr:uncharacterized protein LOC109707167 [Ananas comosus]
MIVSIVASSSPPSPPLLFRPCALTPLSTPTRVLHLKNPTKISRSRKQGRRRGRRGGVCRAELTHDAPFAVAIGACVLNSLIFPVTSNGEDDDGGGGGAIDSTDTRLAVMAIISFIPYFNWMSWVFAWLDSGRQRYLVYSIVYLAPYLRTNLSLSPDESWLPIASILICIAHIQLETSIKNGDLNGINLFEETLKLIFPKKETQIQGHRESSKKGRSRRDTKLPSAHESRERFREWVNERKPLDELENLNENTDAEEEEDKSQ